MFEWTNPFQAPQRRYSLESENGKVLVHQKTLKKIPIILLGYSGVILTNRVKQFQGREKNETGSARFVSVIRPKSRKSARGEQTHLIQQRKIVKLRFIATSRSIILFLFIYLGTKKRREIIILPVLLFSFFLFHLVPRIDQKETRSQIFPSELPYEDK